MKRHCLARCGVGVGFVGNTFVPDLEGAGSSRLGTAKDDIARLALTKPVDNVMPIKAATKHPGWETAIIRTLKTGLCCEDGARLGRARYRMISGRLKGRASVEDSYKHSFILYMLTC